MIQSDTDFSTLVNMYQQKVYNHAYRMLGNREESEDATQDIFLRVYGSLKTFRGEAKLSSWVFKITANVCISRMRRKQLPSASLDAPLAGEDRSLAELVADESDNPETICSANEMGSIVREQLRRLKPEWAQAIGLHYFGGLSYEEVAEALEIPRDTVATYIRRGKIQLAGLIESRIGADGL
ncbi:sigma-70 family RNA polymerase sigma factor [bacterium]|nr:sigma-70 family RNA polymerase sigma factor [bacterium]